MSKTKNHNIFLIGPMGAGKSSVGRFLAKHLDMDFFDTDEEIEKSTGVDLGWIFDVEGEEGFRRREMAVVADIAKRSHIILATGGGTVIVPENQTVLTERGSIVYLEVSLENQNREWSTISVAHYCKSAIAKKFWKDYNWSANPFIVHWRILP